MNSRWPLIRMLPIMALVVVFGVLTPAAAQTHGSPMPVGGTTWSLIDAIGFGGFGFGLGLTAAWDLEGSDIGPPGTALAVVGATTVAGTIAGAVIGRRAEKKIAQAKGLETAHRAAVVSGVIMAGGTLGALSAIPLINSEGEGTALGPDEQTVALLVLAGSALGSLFVWKRRDELGFRSISLVPTLPDNRGSRLHLRVSF